MTVYKALHCPLCLQVIVNPHYLYGKQLGTQELIETDCSHYIRTWQYWVPGWLQWLSMYLWLR